MPNAHDVATRAESDADAADEDPTATFPMAKKPRSDAVRNRQRLIEAAGEVFADRGSEATLNDVAARAGCGIGTVYRHFPSKDALVEALFVERLNEIVGLAEEALEIADPWAGFLHFLERSLELQVLDRGLRYVLLHTGAGHEKVRDARERVAPLVAKLVQRAIGSGRLRSDFEELDIPFVVTMIGSAADYARGGDPQLWRRYLAIFVDGLRTERAATSSLGPPPSREAVDRIMAGQGR